MANRTRKPNAIDCIMAEHIALPGCPQVIVTRGFAYQWLVKMGHDPKTRGFGSIDYMVFGGRRLNPSTEPLTDLAYPSTAYFLACVEADLLGLPKPARPAVAV